MQLRSAIQHVQEIGEKHGFCLVIVGGSAIRLIGNKTIIAATNQQEKTITLDKAENPTTRRSDHTIVDLDMIAFAKTLEAATPVAFARLQRDLKNIIRNYKDFPAISLEPVLYHPTWKNPNLLIQFNSSIEKDDKNYYFRLDNIVQEVQVESLDFWTWTFAENPKEHITTFSPPALQMRYGIRGFSKKPKDKKKIWSKDAPFAQFVEQFNHKTNHQYENTFSEWHTFEKSIERNKSLRIQIKRMLYQIFWLTIGTYLAHGTGVIGKILLPFGNTIFAGK